MAGFNNITLEAVRKEHSTAAKSFEEATSELAELAQSQKIIAGD